MQEIAPGVSVPASAKRVVFQDDPTSVDYAAALDEAHAIRSELSSVRHRLIALYQRVDRGAIPSDSITLAATGAVDCAIIALYKLVDGERSFGHRQALRAAMEEDEAMHPERYVVKPTSRCSKCGRRR